MMTDGVSAGECAAAVARSSWGRLLALLAARFGDIIAAEDALADAFERALKTWPDSGVPARPEAWLFTAARNRMIDAARSRTRHPRETLDTVQEVDVSGSQRNEAPPALDHDPIPDERLKLLFVCAHPAIDSAMHTPLMLQTVLALEADVIARAFLVSPGAMAQRLVRCKRKIRDAAIPFSHPPPRERAARLDAVLEAIYGAWSASSLAQGPVGDDTSLIAEALFLAVLAAEQMPGEAEAAGLAALLSFAGARVPAARNAAGDYVPLSDQNPAAWDRELILQGSQLLAHASSFASPGRFQLEAAIQSVHIERINGTPTNWHAVAQLYEGLFQLAPTIGAAVGRAAAIGEAFGTKAGLNALDQIEFKLKDEFQPAWATRAALLARDGHGRKAREAYARAIELTMPGAVRNYLIRCRDALD